MRFNHRCCSVSEAERKVARMSLRERLKHMKTFRQLQGNRCFKKQDFNVALMWYEKSLTYYEYCFPSNDWEIEAIDEERKLCLVNSAACHLELKEYRQCIECCTEALEVAQGRSIKALYRRAKAYRYLCNFDQAIQDLKKAKGLLGKDSEEFRRVLHEEYVLLQEEIQCYRKRMKAAAQRMMGATI